MNKIDEQFIKEKVNPVVGFIFHTARQLGQDNAPASMDMQYLKQGTEKVCELLREASPTAPPEDAKALEDAIEQLTQDANFAEAIGQASDRAFAADLRTVINAARSREQYAAKQIERDTLTGEQPMKSEDVSIWQIIRHIFGFHTWSEDRWYRHPDWGPNPPSVRCQNCEICGRERVERYNGSHFYWEKMPKI